MDSGGIEITEKRQRETKVICHLASNWVVRPGGPRCSAKPFSTQYLSPSYFLLFEKFRKEPGPPGPPSKIVGGIDVSTWTQLGRN